ncbi:hypothetical protein M5X05_31540 [Paenibacillus alvei]|uniref:hypothetical protein n=1 Tax=Paenibacillus alvei TaxID=44250 RepID=UPI0009DAEE1E|nr:hypothetical protein [Paenibacillus alvei]MCY9708694.1 hypothetical protein [Paenibacillus alvei]
MSRNKITKTALVNIAERANASIEFNSNNAVWARECGDLKWCKWRTLYQRLNSRLRYKRKKGDKPA